MMLIPRDLHGPGWTFQVHYHQCSMDCPCWSAARDSFNICPVCDGERGRWWNRPDIADLMATYVMEEYYEGDLPDNLELVMVFEEDDYVATWPNMDFSSPDPGFVDPELPDEDPDEGMMPPRG